MSELNDNSKSKLHGLWALTNRDLKKWYKAPVIFLLSIIQPILWMGLLGKAMNIGAIFSGGTFTVPSLTPPLTPSQLQQLGSYFAGLQTSILQGAFNTTDYFSFMAVGMISFTALFTTMFSGMSVVWDRRLGFLNKALSTPVSRAVIIFSKVLSATLRSMFQAGLIILIAVAFGLQFGAGFSPLYVLGVFAIMFLICVGLSSIFIAITIRSTRIETPMAVVNLINLPLMFASNAFFPIKFMPDWLQTIAKVNPLTYTTDAVRQLLIFSTDWTQLALDFAYVGVFAVIAATIGIVLSWRFLSK
ncbi:multidrug ABC transporter permease [Candidatus Bathyarchaeota archaeon CG07_land_8_20_14_0_80_47_9]|nr:MAG: multidrug ABC transporter permease [Candidatus Bathyarchaeota archaeon CG07_land_8_20_14_0_80_47_9]